ncbi:restriction endonuclease subunit S [Lactococcus lactis]|uniref:Restriction endonuclease subunit S n=1 Tax=Lactococcus lactis TaxID=1358 RepID=A0AAW8UMG7_9LACT|nr:restriction endonuclease subunit S [Lactococcus lactis]MDT2947222.1 restriction endonuclease subunit S [Lactococcus lactis]
MEKFKMLPLSEIAELVIDYRGKTPKKLGGDWSVQGYRAISAKNVKTRQIVQSDSIRYLDESLYRKWMKEEIKRGDILITSEAPFGQLFYWDSDEKIVLSQRLFALRCKKEFYSPYIFHYMTSDAFQSDMECRATGTTVTGLRQPELLKCRISVPSFEKQKIIADTLSTIDAKIENNKRINHHLVELARSFWQERFSSKQPNGKLGDIIELFDSKRVPLSANQREKMDKTYPYYGATSLMDYVDDYLFDGTYLLLGEDGTVIDKEGYPILQYVWGKFWVNNHAHIMVGKNGFTVESLFVLLKNTCVSSIVTGAVQLKINQANLKSVDVYIPQKEELDNFNSTIEPIFDQLRNLYDEIKSLTTLRDALLPKLMSGEISVAD